MICFNVLVVRGVDRIHFRHAERFRRSIIVLYIKFYQMATCGVREMGCLAPVILLYPKDGLNCYHGD
jgi:hypothetical protein